MGRPTAVRYSWIDVFIHTRDALRLLAMVARMQSITFDFSTSTSINKISLAMYETSRCKEEQMREASSKPWYPDNLGEAKKQRYLLVPLHLRLHARLAFQIFTRKGSRIYLLHTGESWTPAFARLRNILAVHLAEFVQPGSCLSCNG